nr:immunoglobulin light chain junction region [Macaca mulatta]MOW40836.1 immunoglobulin light chain junction region [Macaca mulatta]MOW41116.1 immunoglobulin light chain junction region [Macaca mulatta]MOW41241.1 immunoglobulin light chain junction region [Macaca mulatta]MOW41331.1 immunoglobulin light chain junction region [Macaca mulatta]
CQHSYGAPPTF